MVVSYMHPPPPSRFLLNPLSSFLMVACTFGGHREEKFIVCSSSASKSDLKGYLTTLSASKEQREVKRQLCIIVMGKNTAV